MPNTLKIEYEFDYPIDDINIKINSAVSQNKDESSEQSNAKETKAASQKIRTAVILEILKKLNINKSNTDKATICRFISCLTGCSYKQIYKDVTQGIHFSGFHKQPIVKINKIIHDLNADFTVDSNKEY
jgi:hypothetical protein